MKQKNEKDESDGKAVEIEKVRSVWTGSRSRPRRNATGKRNHAHYLGEEKNGGVKRWGKRIGREDGEKGG